MKDFIYCTIITLLIVGFGCKIFVDIHKQQREENQIHFIWNDDEESIPMDGELIIIEFTDENNVYIGPTNKVFKGSLYKESIDRKHLD